MVQEEQKIEEMPVCLSNELVQSFEQLSEKLIQERKQTKPPSDYTSKKEIQHFKLQNSFEVPDSVKSFDLCEDLIILMTQANNRLLATDFNGKKLYEQAGSGNAKFLPAQSDKILMAGQKSSIVNI